MIQSHAISANSFVPYFTGHLVPLYEQKYPMLSQLKSMCSKVNLTEVGMEQINTKSRIALQLKGGADPLEFPRGSVIVSDRYKVFPIEQAYTAEINGNTFRNLNSGNPSMQYTNSVADLLKGLMEEYYHKQEQFLPGNGSGVLAVVDASSTTTAVRVKKTGTALGSSFGSSKITPRIASGVAVLYDIVDTAAATPVQDTNVTVDSITPGATYDTLNLGVTLSGAPAAGEIIVFKDSYRYAPYGFDYMVQSKKTGVWQGLDVTNLPQHQSVVVDGGGAVFDEFAFEGILQAQALFYGQGQNPTFKIFAAPGIVSRLRTNAISRINYANGAPKQHNLGVKEAGYQDSIFVEWPWCDAGSFFAGDFKEIVYGEQYGLQPVTDIDNRMWKQSLTGATGTDAYFAQFHESHNFLIRNPRTWIGGKNYDAAGTNFGSLPFILN